jgi:L-malate glycosyltransferase
MLSRPEDLTVGLMGPIETASFQDIFSLKNNVQSYPKGLGGSPVNLMARELHRRGYTVVLYTLDPTVDDEVIIRGERLTIYFGTFRSNRARDFFTKEIKWLTATVLKHPSDILHAHWTYEYALSAQATGLPYLVTAHDAPLNILKHNLIPYRIVRTLMAYKAILKTTHLSAVSPYVANHLKKYFFYYRPIRVIPNGMPDSIFNRVRSQKSKNSPVVFASILSGWSGLKNSEAAIHAFSIVRKSNPNCCLLMFGAGHGVGEEAEHWANSRGLADSIEFVGYLPYQQLIERLCNEVDILVHPALEEAQPMSMIEAMSVAIPVIAGERSGGVPWTLDYGNAGVLVDVRKPEQIAKAMLELMMNFQERHRVGHAGLALAKQRFHISIVTNAYLKVYEDILTGKWK